MIAPLSQLTPTLLLLAGGDAESKPIVPVADEGKFAKPVMLMTGDKPAGRGLLYPSPALFDVDGDGSKDLVMGDLRGFLHVANRAPGAGDHGWSETTLLKDKEGKDIKFSNW